MKNPKLSFYTVCAALGLKLAPPDISNTEARRRGWRRKPTEADVYALAAAARKRTRRAERNARNYLEDLSTRKAFAARGIVLS